MGSVVLCEEESVVASQAGDISQIHPSEVKLTAIRTVHYSLSSDLYRNPASRYTSDTWGSIVTVLLCFVRVPKSFQV